MALNPKNRKLDKNGNPIVTKEELEKSGMSLRDFLNKERGLTRRTESAPSNVRMRTPSDADISRARSETAKAKSSASDLNREINREGARQVQRSQEESRRVPASRLTPRQMESAVKKSPTEKVDEHWSSHYKGRSNVGK